MERHLKILFVEDSETDVDLIQWELKKGGINFTGKTVDRRDDFEDALANFNPDVILCDHSLPQFNSHEALKIYKNFHFSIPFILVTGAVSEEFAVKMIKEGADDYILKSNLMRLSSAIIHALKTRKAEHEREKAFEEIKQKNVFMEQLMNSQPVVFYIAKADSDHAITSISDNVQNITGYSAKQFVENPEIWPANVHPDDAERLFSYKEEKQHQSGSAEYRWQCADGTCKWFLDNFTIVKDKNGESHIHGAWIEISDLKNAGLQKLENVKGLEEMLFMTSHKVRQSITQIVGLTDLISAKTNSEADVKRIIEYMKEPAHYLELYTRELTTFMEDLKEKNKN